MDADGDRGLAGDRTRLAWERTALSLLGAAALLATAVVRHPRGWVVTPAIVLLVVAAAWAWRRREDGPAAADLWWVSMASLVAAVGAATVLVLGLR